MIQLLAPIDKAESDDPIQGLAQIAILMLRSNGVTDDNIIANYTTPNRRADARMEAQQLQETGTIYAPALAVKAAMRVLLLVAAVLPAA